MATAVSNQHIDPIGSVDYSVEHTQSIDDTQSRIEALKHQLEYYFSGQNLATDAYLSSHMNAERFVLVDVIAQFPKVKAITEDRDLLVDVIRQCPALDCDESGTMVRPTAKRERKTLLLRDIPQNASPAQIQAIFEDDNCSKVVNMHAEVGDTWYVTFESEEDCLRTALYLNTSGKTIDGNPIRCRVKSENLTRGYFFHGTPGGTPPPPGGIADESQRWGPIPQQNNYYQGGYPAMGYIFPNQPYMMPYAQPWQGPPPVDYPKNDQRRVRNHPRKGRKGEWTDADMKGQMATPNTSGPPNQRRKGGKQYRNKRDGTKPRQGHQPQLGPEHFPALPTTNKKPPTVGYSDEFRKYTREKMAKIIEGLNSKGISCPESFEKECVVVRSSPLKGCLLLDPMPVMYPASPSPQLAAQPYHSMAMPFLDLGMSEEEAFPSEIPELDPQNQPVRAPRSCALEITDPEPEEPLPPIEKKTTDNTTTTNTNTNTNTNSTTSPNPSKAKFQKPYRQQYQKKDSRGNKKYVEKKTPESTPSEKPAQNPAPTQPDKKTMAAIVKAAESAAANAVKAPAPTQTAPKSRPNKPPKGKRDSKGKAPRETGREKQLPNKSQSARGGRGVASTRRANNKSTSQNRTERVEYVKKEVETTTSTTKDAGKPSWAEMASRKQS